MSNQKIIIHQTNTNSITTTSLDGWEFSCHLCGYKARYLIESGDQKLELLNIGDPRARHTSSPIDGTYDFDNSIIDHGQGRSDFGNFEDRVWLPPELEQQLDEILRHLDGDTN